MKYKSIFLCWLLLLTVLVRGQQFIVNNLGKDPFKGKTSEVLYKTGEGEWRFQSYEIPVIKTTYRPVGYTTGEQVSDAVIVTPPALNTTVSPGKAQTITWDNQASVVIQAGKLYYKMGREVRVKSAAAFSKEPYRGFTFQLAQDEHFFGGGERALPMDRRGKRLELYNSPAYGYGIGESNLNFSVPVVFSSGGYAIFFENPSRGYIDIGAADQQTLEAGFVSGELTYYIIFGNSLDEMLQNYTVITGRQPLPPRWALGNFVSRFGYRSEAQVQQVVKTMKEQAFPMDGLVFDLFWFGDSIKGTLGNLDWVNPVKWPDPKNMIRGFRDNQQLKSILITEPFIIQGTRTYEESQPYLATNTAGKPYILSDFYFGKGGLVDIFRKNAQSWIWKYYKNQMANGVTGWWVDLAEPEKHPQDMQHNLNDYGAKRMMGADEVHNVFGHYWSKMLFEKFRDDYSKTRLFNLNRTGFAGSQRYSVFPWTGDVARNWDGLKAQPLVLLGMSLSGLPYVHSDAGGFAMTDKADPELYTRWLQFAAFTPVFRPHGTALEDLDPAVKSIPSEPCFWDEPYKSIVRKYINLRYRLLPYNYTLGYEQSASGKPLMRPLYYYNFSDSNALAADDDEYYWGDRILVAPVTEPGKTSKKLYLPAGRWYQMQNDQPVNGGQWVDQSVSLENIPVYVREGSCIPMWTPADTIRSTDSYDSRNITIRYYPGAGNTISTFFDDDGSSTGTLEKADYEVVSFNCAMNGNRLTLEISTNNPNNYKRKFYRTFRLEVAGVKELPQLVMVDGKTISEDKKGKQADLFQGIQYPYVTIEFNGKPVRIEMAL